MEIPTVRLLNGLVVANFGSSHPFYFDDGTILPACPLNRVRDRALSYNYDDLYREMDGRKLIYKIKRVTPKFNQRTLDEIEEGFLGVDLVLISSEVNKAIGLMILSGNYSIKLKDTFVDKMCSVMMLKNNEARKIMLEYNWDKKKATHVCSSKIFLKQGV